MPYIEKIAIGKASLLNSNPGIYGTFAEIGAGQEVVNHFFKAGKASQTVAKSMSAYDMTFSDQIYGRAGRYVSLERLFKMLNHEYTLLEKRLKKTRGKKTRFFAFADTVSASTAVKSAESYHHGWMGIRFQNSPGSAVNEIILHLDLLDKARLQQYETLGVLGLNLIYSAFYEKKDSKNIIKSLIDNFESSRVDINVLSCRGRIFKNLNHQKLNMELIRQGLTDALLFRKGGANILPSDALYEKNILVVQHQTNSKTFFSQIKQALSCAEKTLKHSRPQTLIINVPLAQLKNKTINKLFKQYSDFSRLFKNHYILVSNFHQLYELRQFIRKAGDRYIFLYLTAEDFAKVMRQIKSSGDSNLEFFSKLYDRKTQLITASARGMNKKNQHLEKHLLVNKKLALIHTDKH